ncbi:DUF5682 family protein, partial [Pseudovibrio denitrificans]|uniref:DUF5682 family protein n=1 Tax=Pseudovibrio denitrificans TaxID=258256 RepID=UPI0006CF96A8
MLDALEDLCPVEVLIEGPADLSSLIPMLGSAEMKPPVALLAYLNDTPEDAVFWPFSEFSPEYQAICWAHKNQVPVRFIDLPTHWHLLERDKRLNGEEGAAEEEAETALANNSDGISELSSSKIISRDPIGVLATLAGYEDGESWWQDVIEENPSSGPVFAAVTDAMKALRAESSELDRWDAAREAHMRLEIAKSAKACEAEQHVAVVCGAWHVPALMEKFTAKDDRALLKGMPKKKVSATWTPWTAPRLCYHTGYGAGVASPGWCLHLWESPDNEKTTRWVIKIAKLLRESGHIVSTASLIETERLASSLASILGKPRPGYEELRDAAIATLCSGNALIWETISAELLIGSDVGAIPSDVPMAPLLEDLQRQQKKARLKPEALERELSIDLRSESGQFRSTLLHRLSILSVPWGRELDKGRSRGTFRERWRLCWEPTFAVELVENLVFGSTIQNAASGKILRRMRECGTLSSLADAVFEAMTAQLPEAANEQGKL